MPTTYSYRCRSNRASVVAAAIADGSGDGAIVNVAVDGESVGSERLAVAELVPFVWAFAQTFCVFCISLCTNCTLHRCFDHPAFDLRAPLHFCEWKE